MVSQLRSLIISMEGWRGQEQREEVSIHHFFCERAFLTFCSLLMSQVDQVVEAWRQLLEGVSAPARLVKRAEEERREEREKKEKEEEIKRRAQEERKPFCSECLKEQNNNVIVTSTAAPELTETLVKQGRKMSSVDVSGPTTEQQLATASLITEVSRLDRQEKQSFSEKIFGLCSPSFAAHINHTLNLLLAKKRLIQHHTQKVTTPMFEPTEPGFGVTEPGVHGPRPHSYASPWPGVKIIK